MVLCCCAGSYGASKRVNLEVAAVRFIPARTISFIPRLAERSPCCRRDVKTLCRGVLPGSARVIACLQGQRGGLSKQCRATLFNHEVRLAGA